MFGEVGLNHMWLGLGKEKRRQKDHRRKGADRGPTVWQRWFLEMVGDDIIASYCQVRRKVEAYRH